MKFGYSSRSHRKTWFITNANLSEIYTFNCRDLRWPRLISHVALAQRRKNIGCRGKQERSKHRDSLSSFFLLQPICYRSRFGRNRTSINRPKIFDPFRIHGRRAVFSQIRRKPRGRPHRWVVIVAKIRPTDTVRLWNSVATTIALPSIWRKKERKRENNP